MKINIGLEECVRMQLAQQLKLMLADTYMLYTKTRNFQWNVSDPRFYSLHLSLEKQNKELADALDEIAERIRILGERCPATLRQFIEMTTLREPESEISADELVKELLDDHEKLCVYIRERIELSFKLGDEGTAALLIQRLRDHEKSAWILRNHQNRSK
jgi:starvation-inducible DNA-binding protein